MQRRIIESNMGRRKGGDGSLPAGEIRKLRLQVT